MTQLRRWVVVDIKRIDRPSPMETSDAWQVRVRHRDGTVGVGSHPYVDVAIFCAKEDGATHRREVRNTRRAERIRRRLLSGGAR